MISYFEYPAGVHALDSKNYKIGQNLGKIAQNVWKVCEEWEKECVKISESKIQN